MSEGAKLATGCLALLIQFAIMADSCNRQARCYATDAPTGHVRCWSGGALVFEADTYRNGGVLCTADGRELKLNDRDGLCVEESRQADTLNPPVSRGSR